MSRFFPRRTIDGEDYSSRILAVEEFLGRLGDLPTTLAAEAQAEPVPVPPPSPSPYSQNFGDLDDVTDNGVTGDIPVLMSGQWTGQQWTPGVLGIGMNVPTTHRFEMQDVTSGPTTQTYAAQSVDTVIAYFTQFTTPNSGLRGLHLQKKSDSAIPLGITLEYDTGPLWDTAAIDATTTDLVLAFSHVLKADNLRLRADTAQMAFGRVVGQPSQAGAQLQEVSGNTASITAITKAASAVVTVGTNHRFAVGESVTFKNVAGMTEINGQTGTISAMDATTITVGINSTGFSTYTSGGNAFVQMTGISMTGYGNFFGLLLLQGITGTKRTKISFNNNFQFGTDANENGTADFWWFCNATGNFPFYISATDKVFFGAGSSAPSPTARVHIGAGTATANTAPLKFTSGTNLTTAEAGAFEYDGSLLYFTPTGTTRKVVVLAPVGPSAYTPTNVTVDRSYDANATTLEEVADILGTLIADLQATNIIG